METSVILKIVAIVVVIVMGLSMLAAGFLYLENPSSQNNGGNSGTTCPQPTASTFTYSLSFDSNALKDLGTIRMGAYTSSTDKAAIDSAVGNVSGVSKVTSQFSKTATDSNEWAYLADISLKKGSDPIATATGILDINYFDQSRKAEFFAAKYITISVPSSTIIHNSDLNIDRNYSFDTTTLSALAGLTTSPGDNLIVGGTMKLTGATITSISLAEEQNLSQAPPIDANSIVIDTNSVVDSNSVLVVDTNKGSSDSNK